MNEVVGKALNRVDGRLKVMGQAKYSADLPARHLTHAVFVTSSVTRGTIVGFDLTEAKKIPGFLAFYSHESGFKIKPAGNDPKSGGKAGNDQWLPMQDGKIHYNGQQIGLVVAETLESATEAAFLVKVNYNATSPRIIPEEEESSAFYPKDFFNSKLQDKIGDPDKVFASQPEIVIHETYSTPVEHHHPIEFHATVAQWDGPSLTVYDTTQNVVGTQNILATMMGIKPDKVKVISHFLGGGFGCKGFFWPHTAIAAAAAKKIGRPVKLSLTREQMFTSNGHRSATKQEMTLAASRDGKLLAIKHHTSSHTSQIADFPEACGLVSKMLYDCANVGVVHKVIRLDAGTPTPMRGPGETPGTFALESAMDELAYKINMDPLKLRLVNYSEKNCEDGKEFSGKHLRECYEKGAEVFGWSRRKMEPRSMTDNGWLVGWGMATATYPGNRVSSSASARFQSDGKLIVKSATQDIGTGTYTILSQIAADSFGIPMEQVQCELGDSTFPKGPLSGGSQTSASAGPSVKAACVELKQKLLKASLAHKDSPLHGLHEKDVTSDNGKFSSAGKSVSFTEILKQQNLSFMDATAEVKANTRPTGEIGKLAGLVGLAPEPDTKKYSFHSFGAHFVEVRVNPESGEVRMGRMVGVFDIGRVLNHKTARSQCIGGMTWGIGQALLEETVFDRVSGRIATRNLADYHLPVHADTPPMDVFFTETPDLNMSDIGSRGVGELPLTGAAAAIANAVYHATGKRIRDLPIVPEKLL